MEGEREVDKVGVGGGLNRFWWRIARDKEQGKGTKGQWQLNVSSFYKEKLHPQTLFTLIQLQHQSVLSVFKFFFPDEVT